MQLKFTFILIIFFTSLFTYAQTFDIKFVGDSELERINAFSVTSDNEILVANTLLDDSNDFGAYQIMKLDANGNILTTRTFGNTIKNRAIDVLQSPQGDIFFLGENGVDLEYELVKLDTELNILWTKIIKNDSANGSLVLVDEKILVTSYSFLNTAIIMFDFDGNLLWETILADPIHRIITKRGYKSQNGKIFVTGAKISDNDNSSNGILYKISENGNVEWETTLEDSYNSVFRDVFELGSGELLVAGAKQDASTSIYSATITKFDNLGNVIFQKSFDNDNSLFGKDVIVHNDLIFLLCTTSSDVFDIMLLILDMEGTEISRHNLGDDRDSNAEQIKLIGSDELLIIGTGTNTIPEENNDLKFIKISDLENITGINDLTLTRSLNFFPNPIQQGKTLSFGEEVITGTLIDQLGKKVLEVYNANQISTTQLSAGIYFLYGVSSLQENLLGKVVVVE